MSEKKQTLGAFCFTKNVIHRGKKSKLCIPKTSNSRVNSKHNQGYKDMQYRLHKQTFRKKTLGVIRIIQ